MARLRWPAPLPDGAIIRRDKFQPDPSLAAANNRSAWSEVSGVLKRSRARHLCFVHMRRAQQQNEYR
jgi:hypothetical protein